MKPNPVYLKPGDRIELGISSLGTQYQVVVGLPTELGGQCLIFPGRRLDR